MKQTRRSFLKSAIATVIVATTPLPKLPKLIVKKTIKYASYPFLTLMNLAKRSNDKSILDIAEILNEKNEMLKDAQWVEAETLMR